jgi:serine/threonine-protein kinase HipA
MSKTSFTVQLYRDHHWVTAGELRLGGRPTEGADFTYDIDYWIRCCARAPQPVVQADAVVSTLPPSSETTFWHGRWPAFLDDIRPGGAANRWWRRQLSLPPGDDDVHALEVFRRGTGAPVGHIRILESVLDIGAREPVTFEREDVVRLTADFMEEASRAGVAVGGATGAGGDAPKLLLRQDPVSGRVWIDPQQQHHAGFRPDDDYVFVKFARGERSEDDRLILRAEAAFYRVAHALGLDTLDVTSLHLEESAGESPRDSQPSLWVRRFDIVPVGGGRVERLAVESFYALMGAAAGSRLYFPKVLERLLPLVGPVGMADLPRAQQATFHHHTAVELLKRDLLNMLLGNTDNHGRNWAVVRTDTEVRLAPVYDLAPMRLDPGGVVRMTRWEDPENSNDTEFWLRTCRSLGHLFPTLDADSLFGELAAFAAQAQALPDLLRQFNAPAALDSRLQLGAIAGRLRDWGLLP